MLDDYAGPCCAKFKKKPRTVPSGSAEGSATGALPESLDRAMISASVAAVRPRIAACADNSSAKGRVKVHVRVGSDGTVTSTSVSESPDGALAACVTEAVSHAVFPRTQNGGSFSYPFTF